MAKIPDKLKLKLNTMLHELGDWKLGNILQDCFDEINGNSSGGLVMTKYPSTAAYESANGGQKTPGGFFINTTTNNIMYCCDGQYFEIDLPSLQAQIAANAECCSLNAQDIVTINAAIEALQNAFATHNHDGVNSPRIELKGQLLTGALNGAFLFVNNGVVDCKPLDVKQDIFFQGNLVEGEGCGFNFIDDCFSVTTNAEGIVQIGLPTLKTALADIEVNKDCCTTNTASIAALTLSLTNTNANVAQNATQILELSQFDLAHKHTGGADGCQLDPLASLQSTGVIDCQLLASDGNGGLEWKSPLELTTSVTLCGKNVGPTTAQDIFLQVDPADSCFEFRKIEGDCGIAVTVDPTDNNLEVALDFANMQNIGTAVDPDNDYILVHDTSTGLCTKTNVSNLVPTVPNLLGGKLIDITPNGNDNTVDVNFNNVTATSTIDNVSNNNGFLLAYDPASGDCVRISASDLIQTDVNILGGKLIDITTVGNDTTVDVDFNNVTGSQTLANLDNSSGFILAYDPSINDCVRVNISEFLMANIGVTGGKLITATTTGNNVALDVDFTAVTQTQTLANLSTTGGFVLAYDPAINDCVQLSLADFKCKIGDLEDVCITEQTSVVTTQEQTEVFANVMNANNERPYAISFQVQTAGANPQVCVYLSAHNGITGTLTASLVEVVNGVPTATVKANTTSTVNMASLTTTAQKVCFDFPGYNTMVGDNCAIQLNTSALSSTGFFSFWGNTLNTDPNSSALLLFNGNWVVSSGGSDPGLEINQELVTPAIQDGQTICWNAAQNKFLPADKGETQEQDCFTAYQLNSSGGLIDDVWVTRVFNEIDNPAPFASINAGQFTLTAPGNGCCYKIKANAQSLKTGRALLRIFDLTAGQTIQEGVVGYSGPAELSPGNTHQADLEVCAEVCITQNTVFEIQHIVDNDSGSPQAQGLGVGSMTQVSDFRTAKLEVYKVRDL